MTASPSAELVQRAYRGDSREFRVIHIFRVEHGRVVELRSIPEDPMRSMPSSDLDPHWHGSPEQTLSGPRWATTTGRTGLSRQRRWDHNSIGRPLAQVDPPGRREPHPDPVT
jgi:hypothetical protein